MSVGWVMVGMFVGFWLGSSLQRWANGVIFDSAIERLDLATRAAVLAAVSRRRNAWPPAAVAAARLVVATWWLTWLAAASFLVLR